LPLFQRDPDPDPPTAEELRRYQGDQERWKQQPQQQGLLPDLDVRPSTDFSTFGDVWVGYKPNSSTPAHTPAPAATFTLEQRGGKPVYKWTAWHDGYGSGTDQNLRTMIIPKYPKLSNGFRDPAWCEREGDEAWYGTSFELPANTTLPYMWAFPSFESQSYHVTHPNYGSSAYRPLDTDNLGLIFKTGHIPNPGSSSYNPIPPNGYNTTEYLLGSRGARPLPKGKRVDLLTHVIYTARTNGVWQIDYREDGGEWTKLYSNVPGDNALIQRNPHPTLVYNDRYGSPGETSESEGQHIEMQAYGDAQPLSWTSHYGFYTWGLWRRSSRDACLAGFPGGDPGPTPEPPPDGDLDARVAALEQETAALDHRLDTIEADMGTLG
jgi:hypothetical protein